MSEYIIEIPDEYFASCDTERDMYYPDERDSAMPITPFVRCHDCKYFDNVPTEAGWIHLCKRGGVVRMVEYGGFCAWGERSEA